METPFEPAHLRAHLSNLFSVKAKIYWADFLFNLIMGYVCFGAAQPFLFAGSFLPGAGLLLIAAFSLYRAVIFIHEISHFRYQLPTFTKWWNILCGIPLGLPSFLYYQSHYAHHRAQTYGTALDGEYIAFSRKPRWEMIKYVLLSMAAPFFLFLRFSVLTLPSFVIPPLRRWLIAYGSSLVIETKFVGSPPTERDRRDWRWQEPATAICSIALLGGTFMGWIPAITFVSLIVLMCTVHLVNALRTLAAHRFDHDNGPMTLQEQYLDSTNLTGTGWRAVVNTLAAPVGLRYHAIHHLYPGIPYHGFGEAYRRLRKALPAEHAFFLADEPSLFAALFVLWKRAGAASETQLETAPNAAL